MNGIFWQQGDLRFGERGGESAGGKSSLCLASNALFLLAAHGDSWESTAFVVIDLYKGLAFAMYRLE